MNRELQVTTSATEDSSAACLRTTSRVVAAAVHRAPLPVGERMEGNASTVSIRTERCVRSTGVCTRRCATVRVSACPCRSREPEGARLDHDLPVDDEVNHSATPVPQVGRACRPWTRTLGTASIATPLG
jgi:hypothetical protein